jgi:hypothetical protein
VRNPASTALWCSRRAMPRRSDGRTTHRTAPLSSAQHWPLNPCRAERKAHTEQELEQKYLSSTFSCAAAAANSAEITLYSQAGAVLAVSSCALARSVCAPREHGYPAATIGHH